jgi:hypothetical protein
MRGLMETVLEEERYTDALRLDQYPQAQGRPRT